MEFQDQGIQAIPAQHYTITTPLQLLRTITTVTIILITIYITLMLRQLTLLLIDNIVLWLLRLVIMA